MCFHQGGGEQGSGLDGFMDIDQFPVVDVCNSVPWPLVDHNDWNDIPMQPMFSADYLAPPQLQAMNPDPEPFNHQRNNPWAHGLESMSGTIDPHVFQNPPIREASNCDTDHLRQRNQETTMSGVELAAEGQYFPDLPHVDLDDHTFSPPTSDIEYNTQPIDALHPRQNVVHQHGTRLSMNTHTNSRNVEKLSDRGPQRLSEHQTLVLRNWFYFNICNPYPDQDEMLALQLQTDLTLDQVRNWFNRTRRRKLPHAGEIEMQFPFNRRTTSRRGSSDSNMSKGKGRSQWLTDNVLVSSESLNCHHGTTIPYSQLGTSAHADQTNISKNGSKDKVDVEHWLTSMTEEHSHRPRAPTITINGSQLGELEPTMELNNDLEQSPVMISSPTGLAPDISDVASDMAYSTRSMQSSRTGRSHNSIRSISSCSSRGSRRGRRRFQDRSCSPSQASSFLESTENGSFRGKQSNSAQVHFCYICHRGFDRKYSLERHLKTVHELEKRPWICNWENLGSQEQPRCIFCHFGPPTVSCGHRTDACESKGEEDRSYWRRDQFMQHLELVHKVDKQIVSRFQIDLDQWRVPDVPDQFLVADIPATHRSIAEILQPQQAQKVPMVKTANRGRIRRTIYSVSKVLAFGSGSSNKRC